MAAPTANIRVADGRAPFSGTAAVCAAAVNRRHEHSATAAESFRSERHRSDGGTRAWPKVPSAVGRQASRQVGTRETGRRNRKRREREREKKGKDKGREEEKSRESDELTRATVPGVCASSRSLSGRAVVERRVERAELLLISNMERRPIAARVVIGGIYLFFLLNYTIFNRHIYNKIKF